MAKVVHLIIWRNAWVWAGPLLSCPTQCSLHIEHPSLSSDRGTMFKICESRTQDRFVDQGLHMVPLPRANGDRVTLGSKANRSSMGTTPTEKDNPSGCRLSAAPNRGPCVNGYLVDPASSHMLVSKIKPCMSKYKQICTVKLRMAH